MQLNKAIPVYLLTTVNILWMAFFPVQVKAQFILSGDFNGRLSSINLHRSVSVSLNNKTLNFIGFGELDLNYLYKK